MTGRVKFIKVQGAWYADLPQYIEDGGNFADCLMVAGAPELIEKLGGTDSLTVTISDKWIEGSHAILIKDYATYTEDDPADLSGPGWSYYVALILPRRISKDPSSPFTETFSVGLCPVNAWVFGGQHPNTIFIKLDQDEKDQ